MQTIALYIIPTLLFIIWQYQATNEGREEGLYYSAKGYNPRLAGMDEHSFWTWQRIAIASGFVAQYITALLCYNVSWWIIPKVIGISLAYMLVFSFWHNGSLYVAVNKYTGSDAYPGGWKASPDGKAKNDFTFNQRRNMMIIGFNLFIITLLSQTV